MKSLQMYAYKLWLALVLALALVVLPSFVVPLVGDELAELIPGASVVLADESESGTAG